MKKHAWLFFCFVILSTANLLAEGRRYAVLIGVNDYIDSGILDLSTPRNDAKDLGSTLSSWNKIFIMTDDLDLRGVDAPLKANIENRLTLLAELTSPNDTILVFFSGHGYSSPNGDARILPLDSGLNRLNDTTLSIATISEMLSAKGKRNILFMVDACRENLSTTKGLSVVGITGNTGQKLNAFYATQSGWYSYEDANKKNGVFTKFIIEGLAGSADLDKNGIVTTAELSAWLPQSMADYALARGIKQKPYIILPDTSMNTIELSNPVKSKPSGSIASTTVPTSAGSDAALTTGERMQKAQDYLAEGKKSNDSGKNGAALDFLQKALSYDPENPELFMELGRAYMGLKKLPKAMEYLASSLTLNPKNGMAMAYLAMCHDWQGEKSDAEKLYRAAFNESPDNFWIAELLGSFLVYQRNYDEGIVLLDKSIELNQTWPTSYINKARALLAKGKKSEARILMLKIKDIVKQAGNAAGISEVEKYMKEFGL